MDSKKIASNAKKNGSQAHRKDTKALKQRIYTRKAKYTLHGYNVASLAQIHHTDKGTVSKAISEIRNSPIAVEIRKFIDSLSLNDTI